MPRIFMNRKKYKLNDFSKYISGSMRAKGITQKQMADALEVSQQMFSYKLHHLIFTYADLLTMFEVLGTSDADKLKLLTL